MNDHADQLRRPRYGLLGLAALVVGAGMAAVAWRQPRAGWFDSYLIAWLYWAGVTLGSIAILLLHNLTGGAWGGPVRPALRAAAATLPLVALLFLPIAAKAPEIYPWADLSRVATDELLQHKAPYLNVDAFRVRAGVYFGVWFALLALLAWQRQGDPVPGSIADRRLRRFSGMGLALTGLAVTFASIDWMMSLEPHWFSTIYGVIWFAVQGLAALTFVIVVATREPAMRAAAPDSRPRDALHDLGKLLLAFVMFWAYVSFSQFFIIWSGNLPEEVVWYVRRFAGGWWKVALALALLHFALPFAMLLSRERKRRSRAMWALALWLLGMRWVDGVWQVAPAIEPSHEHRVWLDAALTLAIGGAWLLAFAVRYPQLVATDALYADCYAAEARHG